MWRAFLFRRICLLFGFISQEQYEFTKELATLEGEGDSILLRPYIKPYLYLLEALQGEGGLNLPKSAFCNTWTFPNSKFQQQKNTNCLELEKFPTKHIYFLPCFLKLKNKLRLWFMADAHYAQANFMLNFIGKFWNNRHTQDQLATILVRIFSWWQW